MTEESMLTITRAQSESADLLNVLESFENIDFEFTESSATSLENGFQQLEDGAADLLLAAGIDISNSELLTERFEVVGALPIRDWNYVLVSEDRPQHLPRNAIILSQNQLVRRQLRRQRPDTRIRSGKAHLGITESEAPDTLDLDDLYSFVEWAEQLRLADEIDGYAIPRHIHRLTGFKTRRHALPQDAAEGELFRFLPTPHAGTVIVIARAGFPRNKIEAILDDEAETSWEITEILIDNMDDELFGKVGILARHRQPATLIREAERNRDLLTHNLLVNPEGELTTTEVKVDIQMELVSHRGNATVSIQRIADLEDAGVTARFMSDDWRKLVKLGTEKGEFLDL
ncbi:MAG: hypothetical protein HOE69_01475 [Euryarchaeota archaeon]|nr:hypothetical protein [Euryarchaeota archaeon]